MVTRGPFSRRQMAAMVVVMIVLTMSKLGTSQSNNNSTNTNVPNRLNCGTSPIMSASNYLSNLNSTLAQLRSQLLIDGVYYARAQQLMDQDSVYGLAQCRLYLTVSECVACFDVAVSQVQTCPALNGVNVFLDNCFLRYENIEGFYENPQITVDVNVGPIWVGTNPSVNQPTTSFNQTVQDLLSDIRVATPRTSNFYVASTREISKSNATVYAIGQCVQNTSQAICENCLQTALNTLYSWLPNTEGRTIDSGCFMRYSDTPFFQSNQTTNIVSLLSEGSTSTKLGIIVGASGGVVVVLLILALSMWYKLRKQQKADQEDTSELQGIKNYKYKDLQSATGNFSEDYRVGKGGYGEVFKAIVDNENVVAVKKLNVGYGKAKVELHNEVKLMSNVRHQNLTQLLGWCTEGPDLLLVLEFMPLGSLDKFLWGNKRGTLNWRQRSDIIFGIARGLAHLHDEFHIQIIHRDIKSDNILLDDNFQPKIADFGLARFLPEDQTHVSTRFAGTLGYTAPEYAIRGRLSDKVDTYSFGIVTLEIISGRRCTDVNFEGHDNHHLLEHAWQLYEKQMHNDLIDEALDSKEYEQENVTKIIEIALLCTQSPPTLRPTMSEVVLMLSSGRWVRREQITRPVFVDPDRRIHVDAKGLQKK